MTGYVQYYQHDEALSSAMQLLWAKRGSDGKTALHLCAVEGSMTLVKLLLK